MQQEEYDIYIQKSEELDVQLRTLESYGKKAKVSDAAARVIYFYKNAPKNEFLCGARKDISKRKKHIGELKKLNL